MAAVLAPPHLDTHLNLVALAGLQEHLAARLEKYGAALSLLRRELTVLVPLAHLRPTLDLLRHDEKYPFTQLMDVTAVDWLGAPQPPAHGRRFEVVYHLLALAPNLRVRVKAPVAEGELVPSAVALWPAANWYEREVWDMFGLGFAGHPDLRRLLTDYDFAGHPLRKDFPLTGHVEVYYDTAEQRVAYKPVDLPQDFRRFDLQSPWQAMTGNAALADDAQTFRKEEFS